MSLTENGFERPRLPDIKTTYDGLFTDALGPLNTNPDAVIGQIIGIFSAALDDANEALQNTYDAMYPATATGTSLDGAVSYVGLSRLAATETIVTAAAYGTEGTVIPAGSAARTSSMLYFSTSDVVISRASALDVNIEVGTLTNSASYQIVAGGVSVTYVSDSSATAAEILNGLAALFPDQFIASVSNDVLRLRAADGVTPFALTVDTKLTITRRSSPIVFRAETTGADVVPVGALTAIESAIAGWDELYNLAAGDTGRDVETDAELRSRFAAAPNNIGSATVEAIRSRILSNVDGVTSCRIYENRTSLPVDGIPAHAFESIIQGGNSQDIAEELWLRKPAGIETYGNVSVSVADSNGDLQTVSFSRPVTVYGWTRVTVNALNTEETLPDTAVGGIKQAVLDYAAANFGIGDDIITQRFYGAIYSAVSGLGQITVEVDLTTLPTDTPTYSTANATVGRVELPVFALDRVSVVGV